MEGEVVFKLHFGGNCHKIIHIFWWRVPRTLRTCGSSARRRGPPPHSSQNDLQPRGAPGCPRAGPLPAARPRGRVGAGPCSLTADVTGHRGRSRRPRSLQEAACPRGPRARATRPRRDPGRRQGPRPGEARLPAPGLSEGRREAHRPDGPASRSRSHFHSATCKLHPAGPHPQSPESLLTRMSVPGYGHPAASWTAFRKLRDCCVAQKVPVASPSTGDLLNV